MKNTKTIAFRDHKTERVFSGRDPLRFILGCVICHVVEDVH